MADIQGDGEGDEAEQEADKNWTSTPPQKKNPKQFLPLTSLMCVSMRACVRVHVWEKMPDMYVYTTFTEHAVWVHLSVSASCRTTESISE